MIVLLAAAHAQDVPPPCVTPPPAELCVYRRTGVYGAGVDYGILLDGALVALLPTARSWCGAVAAGTHHVDVRFNVGPSTFGYADATVGHALTVLPDPTTAVAFAPGTTVSFSAVPTDPANFSLFDAPIALELLDAAGRAHLETKTKRLPPRAAAPAAE